MLLKIFHPGDVVMVVDTTNIRGNNDIQIGDICLVISVKMFIRCTQGQGATFTYFPFEFHEIELLERP